MFSLFYIQPKQKVQKVDAYAQALIVPILGAIATDIAIDMGIDFIDEKAKTTWKNNMGGKLWTKYGTYVKDLKPTKGNAGKWLMKIPKWLTAAVIDEVGDYAKDVAKKDKDRKDKNKNNKTYKSEFDLDSVDPFYNTAVDIDGIFVFSNATPYPTAMINAYLNEWVNYSLMPVAYYQRTKVTMFNDFGASHFYLKGGFDGFIGLQLSSAHSVYTFNSMESPVQITNTIYPDDNSASIRNSSFIDTDLITKGMIAFKKYIERLQQQATITYYADGILTTDGYDAYLDLPNSDDQGNNIVYSPEVLDKIDSTKYPALKERTFEFDISDSSVIDADWYEIQEGSEFDFTKIENDLVKQGDNLYTTNNVTYNYDYEPVVNNYYTVQSNEDLANEIKVIVENTVNVNNPSNGNDDGSTAGGPPFYCVDKDDKEIVPCKNIEAIDGSLITYIRNTYTYATDTIKAGVDGLKTLGTAAKDVTDLFEIFFSWLPLPMRTLMGSGLALVLGVGIFRAFRR